VREQSRTEIRTVLHPRRHNSTLEEDLDPHLMKLEEDLDPHLMKLVIVSVKRENGKGSEK
jgi:hypothetical protein